MVAKQSDNMARRAIELGECRTCERVHLLEISETRSIQSIEADGACVCGSEQFDRLSVDEAFAYVED